MKALSPLATFLFVVVFSISRQVVGIKVPSHDPQAQLASGFLSPWLDRVLWRYKEDSLARLWANDVDGEVSQLGAVAAGPPAMPARRKQMYFSRDSVTYFCVMVLTLQCMVLHTALSVSRNSDELSGETEPSLLTQTLTAAARGIVYPPMMCMLFVACRLYILATTEGQGEPQIAVKIGMVAATAGMTLQFLLVLLLPMFTEHMCEEDAEVWKKCEEQGKLGMKFEKLAGDPTDVHVQMEAQRFVDEDDRATFEAVQVLAVGFIYCGIFGVIVGIFTFPQGTSEVSTAILCTVFLAILYFSVFFLLWLSNMMGAEGEALRAAARQALFPIRKAPMLSVLFLASRMRALHLDPPYGMPPHFQQVSFVVICIALFLETLAALVIGATGEEQAGHYGMPSYKSSELSHSCMHLFAFIVYCGLIPVVYGMSVMTGADGLASHPLSSTTSAVLQLAALYFVVHILQWCTFVWEDLTDTSFPDTKAIVLAADVSVRLCPLISILFIACRLRALQLSHQLGSPQIWAQQAMFMSVFAMLVQMLSCIILPILLGSPAAVDGDGCADWDVKPLLLAYVVTVMKYIALFCLHGGAIMVSIAIFTMSPDTTDEHQAGLLERETLKYCMFVAIGSLAFAFFFSFAKVLGIVFKLAVEGFDHSLLGCEITVGKAAISLLSGWVNISNIVVNNPDYPKEGGSATWASPHLMKVNRIRADLDMTKLAMSGGQVFEFEEFVLQGVDINYDKPWKLKDNVSIILDHTKNLHKLRDVEQSAEDPPQRRDIKVVFHKIRIEGVRAHVSVSGPSALGAHMDIALADLNIPDFEQQISDPEDSEKVQQELLLFVVRSLMETVAANVGPGKQLKGAMKGVSEAAKTVSSCLQGANPCSNVGEQGVSITKLGKSGVPKLPLSA